MSRIIRGLALALAVLLATVSRAGVAIGDEHALSLNEAIAMALQKNEGLSIEREALGAATAAVSGARGAYDPTLGLDGAWQRSRPPVNSWSSGAPAGLLGPEYESKEVGATLRQLLPTGGALAVRARGGGGAAWSSTACARRGGCGRSRLRCRRFRMRRSAKPRAAAVSILPPVVLRRPPPAPRASSPCFTTSRTRRKSRR